VLKVTTHGEITRIWMARGFFGRSLHSVSAYQVGDTLVDSGCAAAANELADWCQGRNILRVVHTHHHEDHTGGDAELVRRFGVEVLAPARTTPILERFYTLPRYRALVWGQPKSVVARPYGDNVEIGGHPFETIPTTGHALDHNCLFDPTRGWLFSGDLFVHRRVTHLRRSEDPGGILDSLRKIAALNPKLMICSHAGVIDRDPVAAIEDRIRFWEQLASEAREMESAGASIPTISRRLLGAEGWMSRLSGGDFSKINLIRGLLRSGTENFSAFV
jgi:glyoxylase-like metal-dependent hydrolase (beta-lactamase superfamily II)